MGNPCAIFDIDGTLANCTHRLHHVKHGARNWTAFFASMGGDTVVAPVREVLWAMGSAGHDIVLCSGRPEDYREQTEAWLDENEIVYDRLYMRPAGDTRPDHVVKSQILDGIIQDGYEPFIVIDDRQSVVDMWRDRGLICLQCAPDKPVAPDTAILSLMVGPSGAGKTEWLAYQSSFHGSYGIAAGHIISSDQFRADLCGDFRDQSKNDQVFDALHAVARTRLLHGLPTVIDATHLRRKDRMASAALAPDGCKVRYFVIDRPILAKRASAGWRNDVRDADGESFDLVGRHHQTFQSQLKDILRGDGLPNVEVLDLRIADTAEAA